jgi:hypothetical protein
VYVEAGRTLSYGLRMPGDDETEELRATELRRELEEEELARSPGETEDEIAQHERRAEKARYLLEKLEERAESEGET